MTSPPVPAGARESRERQKVHLPPLRARRERASLELTLPLPGPDGQSFFLLPVYAVTGAGAPPPESSEEGG